MRTDMARWLIGLTLATFAGSLFFLDPVHAQSNQGPAYELPFGTNPYSPSGARATFKDFLRLSQVPSADYCSTCHQEVHREWRESAHANSFRAPFYLKNVQLLIDQKGIAFTRHCESCHNPIALFSGALTRGFTGLRPFDEEGVSCIVCHSITGLESKSGSGSYVMGVPAVMLNKDGTPRTGLPGLEEIIAEPELHKKAVMHDVLHTPEFCATCHKAAIPAALNSYKWLRAFSVYDEWQQSSWARESTLPFYQKDKVFTCQDCHMQPTNASGSHEASNGKIRSHRFPGANSAIPTFYDYPDQLEAVRAQLQNSLALDIFSIARKHKGETTQFFLPETSRITLTAGDEVTVELVIQNARIGHSLVPEQRDFYECWVAFEAIDGQGHELFQSGGLDENGFLDPAAHTYTNRLIDRDGKVLSLHQVWNTRLKGYDNTILPGRSDLVRYRFVVPLGSDGLHDNSLRRTISLSAKVLYRRFRKQYTDAILEKPATFPILTLGSTELSLKAGALNTAALKTNASGSTALKTIATMRSERDNRTLIRWNNYGIALLGQQQWWAASEAFAKTTMIDPVYADGFVNQAIAEYSRWIESRKENPDGPGVFSLDNANAPPEKFEAALQFLEKALVVRPGYARALFYEGVILRLQNRLEEATRPLQETVRQFPNMRQGHQELGYLLYLRKDYKGARDQFEMVKRINPDDVTACYYLSIVYGQLGNAADAHVNAQLYASHRDDPNNYALNLDFVHTHAEESRELQPYHLHQR
jgi:tetratricopeptide (TPR) repeat protein